MKDTNPFPHLSQATQAAAKIISIGRDLAVLNAELKAVEQARRIGWAAATFIFALLFFILPIFWLTTELHERGWSGLELAGVCALVFGLLSGISAVVTRKAFFEIKKAARSQ